LGAAFTIFALVSLLISINLLSFSVKYHELNQIPRYEHSISAFNWVFKQIRNNIKFFRNYNKLFVGFLCI